MVNNIQFDIRVKNILKKNLTIKFLKFTFNKNIYDEFWKLYQYLTAAYKPTI